MISVLKIGAGCTAMLLLGGCLVPNPGVGPNGELPVIARPYDTGQDNLALTTNPAVAYDPDGCLVWIIDDGVEGVAGRRRDPVSGMPICNNLYPPGTVVGEYRGTNFTDWIPAPTYGNMSGNR